MPDLVEAPRSPVMSDVATRAGVSLQTVSRVVNGHPSVAPATRARVEAAIADLGYRPNTAARALVTRSTRTIGLVVVNITQFGPAHTMLGLEEAARAAGYALSVVVVDDDRAPAMREAVDHLVAVQVDAVVVMASYDAAAAAVQALDVPVPLVTVLAGEAGLLPAATVDQRAGAGLATRHLLDLGHRTVHHVAGPAGSQEARGRVSGWRAALEDAGAPVPEPLHGDWWPWSGYRAGRELLARDRAGGQPVTAVFAANDQMALGLLRAFAEDGVRVPAQVSVVGFDDVPEAGYLTPPLTTVRQDFAELGRRCLAVLLRRLEGKDVAGPPPVQPVLVVRASTAPPPA